jgi:hypothetical protein
VAADNNAHKYEARVYWYCCHRIYYRLGHRISNDSLIMLTVQVQHRLAQMPHEHATAEVHEDARYTKWEAGRQEVVGGVRHHKRSNRAQREEKMDRLHRARRTCEQIVDTRKNTMH